MRQVLLFVLTLGCGASPEPAPVDDGWTDFQVGDVDTVTTRFLEQEVFEVSGEQAEGVRARCPRVQRARAVKETDTFHLLTVEGEQLANVAVANAWLPDGKLAVAQHKLADGALQLPLGCTSCTLILGVSVDDGRVAACTGPGYSLSFADGALTSP